MRTNDMLRALGCAILPVMLAGCGQNGQTQTQTQAQPRSNATTPAADTTVASAPDRTPVAPPAPPSATTGDPAPDRPARPAKPPTVTFELRTEGLPEKGMWKSDPAFGDVNGDGFLDLAALPRLGNGPHVWLGDGSGKWTESSSGLARTRKSCGGGLDLADVNGDGHLDLAVADHCDGIFVYLGNGRGEWMLAAAAMYPDDLAPGPHKVRNFQGAEDLIVGDVNGDGHADIVAGGSDDGGLNVFLGDGTGVTWKRHPTALPTDGWVLRIQLADINLDGLPDIVASHSRGPRVWLNDGDGDWTAFSEGLPSPMVTGLFTGIAVGDVNEDGLPDIAAANWVDGPEVYLQQSGGFWFKTPDVFPDMLGGAIGLDLGRVDGDEHLDLVVSGRLDLDGGYIRGVFLLRGNGLGAWERVEGCGLPSTGLMTTPGVALADVDGDEVLDVAACSGLIIEQTGEAGGPVVPARVLVWTSTLQPERGSAASAD
jgi:hypothetical protein